MESISLGVRLPGEKEEEPQGILPNFNARIKLLQ